MYKKQTDEDTSVVGGRRYHNVPTGFTKPNQDGEEDYKIYNNTLWDVHAKRVGDADQGSIS